MLYYKIQGGKVLIVCSGIFYMRELGPAQTEALYKNTRKKDWFTQQSTDIGSLGLVSTMMVERVN